MTNLKEILARNLKKNRRRLGITQPELAERAGLSTHYLGMVEIARNFPSVDVLERLAEALGIESNELFSVADSPEIAMKQMQQAILSNLSREIELALDKAIEKRSGNVIILNENKIIKPSI